MPPTRVAGRPRRSRRWWITRLTPHRRLCRVRRRSRVPLRRGRARWVRRITYTVTATGTAPITFTASGLPDGLTISTAGAITGTPLTAGTFTGTITAANGTLPNATQPFSIVISAPISAFVSDDFSSGVLNSGLWTFVDPVGDTTPLDTLDDSTALVIGGVLQISVPAGQHGLLPPEKSAARVMQSVANTDFEVEVKFDSAPSQAYQEQGVIVDQDGDNYLAFEVYSDGSDVIALVRNVAGGVISFPTIVGEPLLAGQANYYLRVGRVGNAWTFKYSYDGAVWVTAASFTQNLTVGGIGMYAANESGGTSPAFTALVDYVFNTASPIVPLAAPPTPSVTASSIAPGSQLPSASSLQAPRILSIQDRGDGTVTLRLSAVPGAEYTLQATGDLAPPVAWENVITNAADEAGVWMATDARSNSQQRFYRVVLPPNFLKHY